MKTTINNYFKDGQYNLIHISVGGIIVPNEFIIYTLNFIFNDSKKSIQVSINVPIYIYTLHIDVHTHAEPGGTLYNYYLHSYV